MDKNKVTPYHKGKRKIYLNAADLKNAFDIALGHDWPVAEFTNLHIIK